MVLQCRFSPLTTHTLLVVVVVILFLLSFNAFPLSLSLSLNQYGCSALHCAAEKGFVKMVTVLVAAKANLDLVTPVSAWGRH